MMAPTDDDDEDVIFDHRVMIRQKQNHVGVIDNANNADDEDEDVVFDKSHLLPNHTSSRSKRSRSHGNCRKGYATAVLFMAFCGLGICIALPGPTLIDLQERTNTSTEDVSRIFIGRSSGYLLGSIIGGVIIDCFNKSFLMSMCLLLMAIATAAAPWCTRLYLLVIAIGVQGLGMGLLDAGGNLMCIQIWGHKSPPFMQALHFFFGLGAFVAPLIAEPFMSPAKIAVIHPVNNTTTTNIDLLTATIHSENALQTLSDLGKHADFKGIKGRNEFNHHFARDVRDLASHAGASPGPVNLPPNITSDNRSIEAFQHDNVSDVSLTSERTLVETPKPRKPQTNGNILSKDKSVAGGGIITKQLVAEVQKVPKKLNIATTPVPAPSSTTLSKNTTELLTSDGANSTAQTKPSSTHENLHTSIIQSTTTHPNEQKIPVSWSTKASTTVQTKTVSSPTSSTYSTLSKIHIVDSVTMHGQNDSSDDEWKGVMKPTATVNNTTQIDTFPKRVKENAIRLWNYLKNNVTKVEIAYIIVAILMVFLATLFCSVCCCVESKAYGSITQHYDMQHSRGRESTGFRVQIISLLSLIIFFYVGMENTYGALVMTFAVDYLKWSKSDGSFVNAVFWGSFALTRLLSIIIAKIMHPSTMLIINLVVTTVTLLAMLFLVETYQIAMWIGTALLGIGMASIFPTSLSWAERYINMTGKITAVLIVATSLGDMALPALTGFLFDLKSPMFLIYVLFAGILFCDILYIILQNLASNHGEKYSLLESFALEEDTEDIELDPMDNLQCNHVAKENHIENHSSGKPSKKVTFNLEEEVKLLKDSSGE